MSSEGWYPDRRDMVTRTQLVARYATRTMIRDSWERMKGAAHALDRHMGDIIVGRAVPELKNNEVFEAYEEDVPLRAPATTVGIFRNERDALRRMADADPFEGLPMATLP